MELNELIFPGEFDGGAIPAGIHVERIGNDGRNIEPGTLFFCHKGSRYDAHVLLPTLRDAGCVAAVVSLAHAGREAGIPLIPVADTRRAEAFAVSRFYGSPGKRLTLIGVTGTNGKTGVATMLRSILSDAGIPCGMIGTTGYLGVAGKETAFDAFHEGDAKTMTTPPPLTLYPLLSAMADSGITHVVIEVSSQALCASRVAPLRFAASVFTNLSPEHLDFHKTMIAYLAAKKTLFKQTDVAVVNGDSPWSDLLLDGLSCNRLTCGTLGNCDVTAKDVSLHGAEGVSYLYRSRDGEFPVFLPIPGSFAVQNSLLALTAARVLGVDSGTALASLSHFPGVPGRMERIDTGGLPFSVFIDYAHTEAALRSLLLSVRSFLPPGGRIVLLFGCGGDRDPGKRSEMGKTAEELADFTVVTSDNSRSEDPKKIILEILSGMKRPEKRRVIVKREHAIAYAIERATSGDVILLVGKGHEKYEIDADGKHPFDEKKIAQAALEARRCGHTMEGAENANRNRDAD
ncbi:MAG: UDP-N-acetylmuramoyl-L-alanyl-D-glutamate--2,6-diaminopimelate ligase [Clostridia bacterium]|nr:UDP-N-acetylmuramoyl-L-alanyl-D-glutamate--2,6-diaminopimelate ligase [Clostridia bacterium]